MNADRRMEHGVPVALERPDGLVERMQSGDIDAFYETPPLAGFLPSATWPEPARPPIVESLSGGLIE